MKKILNIAVILIFSINTAYSQYGTIKGQVLDSITGDSIPIASIILMSTDIGNASDFDGYYQIDRVPPGKYDVKVQVISYYPKTYKDIIVKDGNTTVLDIHITTKREVITKYVLTARKRNQTEAAMHKVKERSATFIDGITSESFSKMGVGDAAGAVKRITGLSVESGKYVYVRGLGDRYTVILLNGAVIPGLDPNKNTVQMDLFPSTVIENITVHKTFSAENPGNSTGGTVNIVTKDFPDEQTLQVSLSTGYDTKATFNENYLNHKGGKLDWLGIDDGTRELPAVAKTQIPSLFENNDKLDKITNSFNNNWQPVNSTVPLNHSFSFAYGNKTEIFGKQLGFIASLTYDRDFSYIDDGFIGRYKLVGSNSTVLNEELILSDEKGTMEILMGGLLNLSYQFNTDNKISVNLIYNQSGEKLTRFQEGRKPSDDAAMFYQTRTMQFMERSFTSTQFRGSHTLPKYKNLAVSWLTSLTISKQEQPDLRFFTNDYYVFDNDTINNIQVAMYPSPSRYYRSMKESNFSNRLDFIYPFMILGAKSEFKFGGSYVYKNRDFFENKFSFLDQNDSYNGNIPAYFAENNIGQNAPGTYGVYVLNSINDDLKNSYDAIQNSFAGYVVADMPAFGRLRLIPGIRFEQNMAEVASKNVDKTKGTLNDVDILPSLNISYSLSKQKNIRFAYTRTVSRPSFRELAPYASFDFIGSETIIGNPYLERTLIDNIDLRWENYLDVGEIIAFSLFYKKFDNPVERTFNPEAANPELTWRNVERALLFGLEVEFRKSLGSWISALSPFLVSANFTWIKTTVDIDKKELETVRVIEPDHPSTRVMTGQAPYIVNAAIIYNHDASDIEANISYNVTGRRLSIVLVGGTPDIYEQPFHALNANLTKKFGDHLSIKVAVSNIFDATHLFTYSRFNEQNSWRGEEYIYSKYNIGRIISFGVTWNL